MRIHILCVSKRPRDWVHQATTDYLKRLKGQLNVVVHDIAPISKASPGERLGKEAARLRRLCPAGAFEIALDERGEQWSTLALSKELDRWRNEYSEVVFYIGGAEGLAREVIQSANRCWSLSPLTLPHQLARVVLIEQLYRSWSVLQNHPYHRA